MCNGQSWCQSSYGSQGGWTTSAVYTSDKLSDISSWTGVNNCTQSTITQTQLTTLHNMSIVGGQYKGVTPKYSFNTKRHGWISAGPNTNYYQGAADCPGTASDCPNNSSPQGWYWYNQASDSNMKLTGTNTCEGDGSPPTLYSEEAEGVDDGIDPISGDSERTDIESDMKSKCQ